MSYIPILVALRTWDHVSIAGTWTRVARVKAEYPNQLEYNGLDIIKETFITPKKRYFNMAEFGSISKCIPIPRSMLEHVLYSREQLTLVIGRIVQDT